MNLYSEAPFAFHAMQSTAAITATSFCATYNCSPPALQHLAECQCVVTTIPPVAAKLYDPVSAVTRGTKTLKNPNTAPLKSLLIFAVTSAVARVRFAAMSFSASIGTSIHDMP